MRRSRWLIFGVSSGVLVVAVSVAVWIALKSLQPTVGQSTAVQGSPVVGLPASATNIRYHLPGAFGPVTAYEFDIDETTFQKWVGTRWPQKLELQTQGLIRCLDANGWPNAEHEIAGGLVYTWRRDDQSVIVAFDRRLGRAFCYEASR